MATWKKKNKINKTNNFSRFNQMFSDIYLIRDIYSIVRL